MEEEKNILLPEGEGTTKGAEKNSLPVAGTQYEGTNNESGNNFLLPGRIATALMKNTVSTVSSLEKEYGSPINELVIEGSLDREGNLIKLDTMGTRTLLSLSKQIFQGNNEDVKKYLELTESESKKPANLRREKELDKTPKIVINVLSVSIDLFGKREGSKPRQLIKTFEAFEKLAKMRVPQIISEGIITVENEERKYIRKLLEPYISITGREEQITYIRRTKNEDGSIKEEEVTIPVLVEIDAGRIFYEHNWIGKGSKHFPLPEGILDARLPSGRAITTDIYWKGLFMLAGNYRYHAYSIRYQQVLQQIRNENIIDSERIAQLKEDALTCDNLPIQRIREIVGFEAELNNKIEDYKRKKTESQKEPSEKDIASIIRVNKRRFKEQFWDAMWALIDRGIITDKSDIFWEKDMYKLVFSENKIAEPLNAPSTKTKYERKPGGNWSKNPFAKDESKIRKKKDCSVTEPELFTE